MGVYYAVVCDELQEQIDPAEIKDAAIKADGLGGPENPLGAVVMFALTTRWRDKKVRLADDTSGDEAYDDYRRVTHQVVEEYNSFYNTKLVFQSMDDEDDEDLGDGEKILTHEDFIKSLAQKAGVK